LRFYEPCRSAKHSSTIWELSSTAVYPDDVPTDPSLQIARHPRLSLTALRLLSARMLHISDLHIKELTVIMQSPSISPTDQPHEHTLQMINTVILGGGSNITATKFEPLELRGGGQEGQCSYHCRSFPHILTNMSVIRTAKELGVAVLGYSPIGCGILSG
jgi:hypothetical protein